MAVLVPGEEGRTRLLLHGGFDGAEQLDDLWQLDLAAWQWTRLQAEVGPGQGGAGLGHV